MKKPAASMVSGRATVKTTQVKTKKECEQENGKRKIQINGKKRFKTTLAAHQNYIHFQEQGQQKWCMWAACSQSQCHVPPEVIKESFQEMPSSKKKL